MSRVSQLWFGAALLLVVVALFWSPVDAAYRKPPFNGSIFGKRAGDAGTEPGPAIESMCQIALQACSAWFPGSQRK